MASALVDVRDPGLDRPLLRLGSHLHGHTQRLLLPQSRALLGLGEFRLEHRRMLHLSLKH